MLWNTASVLFSYCFYVFPLFPYAFLYLFCDKLMLFLSYFVISLFIIYLFLDYNMSNL